MDELLLLCGYEAAELEKELPRVKKAFGRLGIAAGDIVRGKERVRTYFDIELTGVRRLLGMFIRELVNIVLARDEGRSTIIHACMAGGFEAVCSAFVTFSRDVFVEVPNPPFMVVFGSILGRFTPILEAAEELWLKSGLVGHCAMVKSRVGILALDLIPRPDVMVTSGLLCETSPKTNDIIHELYGIPTVFYDTCQDRETWEYPDSVRSIALEAASMRRAAEELGRVVGFRMEDEMVRQVQRARSDYGAAVDRVHRLIKESDPVPLGSTHENLLTWLAPAAMSIEGLQRATDAVDTLYNELRERVDQGVGVTPKGAPRILGVLPSHHTDPRLEQLINELGMSIVAVDYELMLPRLEGTLGTDDPYTEASQLLRGSMALPLAARAKLIAQGCRQWKIEGVLDHYHVGCRGVAADALLLQETITKELGIPVLALEWENFDPRIFSQEEVKTKLEVFKSMMESRRQASSERSSA
jgi:benzoyl-CoA reductase/2-hydroxyglutaryl-CoA dehydratase subunit BcrC/BadD/HgdB